MTLRFVLLFDKPLLSGMKNQFHRLIFLESYFTASLFFYVKACRNLHCRHSPHADM